MKFIDVISNFITGMEDKYFIYKMLKTYSNKRIFYNVNFEEYYIVNVGKYYNVILAKFYIAIVLMIISGSMANRQASGERVEVNGVWRKMSKPSPGGIIIFRHPR